MSGNFEYNLTTQSQFQDMKQRNQQLQQQNQSLKKTLQQMIKVNNELSDTIQQFNNIAMHNQQFMKNIKNNKSTDHGECQQMIQGLQSQVQYLKGLAQENMIGGEDQSQIVGALEGLVESFRQAQKYYQDQINAYGQEIDNLKNHLQNKMFKVEQNYLQKTRVLDELIKELKKKEQIVILLQKKMSEETKNSKRLLKKNSQGGTLSPNERKVNSFSPRDKDRIQGMQMTGVDQQLLQLKQKQKKLNQMLKQKDSTIATYSGLLQKLRKKLSEKY